MSDEKTLSDEERLSWLQLSLSENIGPITFRQLLGRYGTASAALRALPELSRKGGRAKPIRTYSRSQAEQDMVRARTFHSRFVCAGEAGYPPSLHHITGAPPLLCVAGRLELAAMDAVAIVGARNASAIGQKFTRMLAHGLAQAGYLVVSGLARGIDTAAHQASVDTQTAAVIAGGIDYFYPPENQALQRQIGETGLLITEMTPGTVPKAEHFPRRNRIISGMARSVVVVEAALRSGSLITARFAAEQGRDVFAVPGSPLDPRCEGTNKLIKDGASILTHVDDVLESLRAAPGLRHDMFLEPASPQSAGEVPIDDSDRSNILALLSPSPVEIDDLIRESGLDTDRVIAVLLELEIAGRMNRVAGNRVALA